MGDVVPMSVDEKVHLMNLDEVEAMRDNDKDDCDDDDDKDDRCNRTRGQGLSVKV